MSAQPPVVHIVDDDASFCHALSRMLRASGFAVRTFASASEFLAALPGVGPGCIILDLQMPGMNGLELQEALAKSNDPLPVVFLTGHGDIPDSVRAMRRGAEDFLTKTAPKQNLLDAVRRALDRDARERADRVHLREWRKRYKTLTPREREVFAHLVGGQLNKQVAADLGTTERTVKAQRASITRKLELHSVADLTRLAQALGIQPFAFTPPFSPKGQ